MQDLYGTLIAPSIAYRPRARRTDILVKGCPVQHRSALDNTEDAVTSRRLLCALAGFVAAQVLGMPAAVSATTIPIAIDTLVNNDLRTYTAGTNYPVAPATLTVGGISFNLVPLGSTPDSLGILQTDQPFDHLSFDISTNILGATVVYTLMNSSFGAFGEDIATIEFHGAGGAFASFELVEGVNIRDHFDGGFNNVIAPGTPSASFGPNDEVRLDRQTFLLPVAFATDTLTHIILTSHNGDNFANGQAFLAAATVETGETASAVPEPATMTLVALGLTGAAAARRKRRQPRA
jgi:PEP-CTERM motif